MYTGEQLSKDLLIRTRQTKSGAYFSEARQAMCIRMAIVKLLEAYSLNSANQPSVDGISKLVKTYEPYTPNNNQVLLKPLAIINAVITSGTELTITFDRAHNLDLSIPHDILIRNVQGTITPINGVTFTSVVAAGTTTTLVVSQTGMSGTYTAGGEAIGSDWLAEYYHLLAVGTKHREILPTVVLSVNSAMSMLTIGENNIRTELMRFSNFVGMTGLSGNFYVKPIGERKIQLFTDEARTQRATFSGTYAGNGKIERIFDKYCEPLWSDQKIDSSEADCLFPLAETNNNRLRVYTSNMNLNQSITQLLYYVDYITVQAEIDTTNTTIDLLQTYNMEFINQIIEKAAEIFFAIQTSGEDVQISKAV